MYSILNPKKDKRISNLFETGKNSDITFISSDSKKINLHKCILTDVEYFKIMFSEIFNKRSIFDNDFDFKKINLLGPKDIDVFVYQDQTTNYYNNYLIKDFIDEQLKINFKQYLN